ncbi:MAG: hypothetical protein V1778_00445 [bacterium]
MRAIVLDGLRQKELMGDDILEHLGLTIRFCRRESGWALLTNVCATTPVCDCFDRPVPFSTTRVIHDGDLIRCGCFHIRCLGRPLPADSTSHILLDEAHAR